MNRLVVAPNWIGDTVMSLPLMRAIRAAHPHDRLAVLARRGPAAIYRAEGNADEVLLRSSFTADVLALRRKRFDEAWLLPNSFRAALLARLGGATRRLGYATDRRSWLLTDAPPPPPATGHQLRDYDALLALAGIPPDANPPRLPLPKAATDTARDCLAAIGLEGRSSLILLCPGSAFDRTKRWPPERYAALADRLREKGHACAVAIGPGERELGARVAAAAKAGLAVLGEDLDPIELAAIFAQARLVVSNDSGPMHLAGAVGTPVVAFFGPTDPARTGPSGSPSRILAPMEAIGVDAAVAAVKELLDQEAGGGRQ